MKHLETIAEFDRRQILEILDRSELHRRNRGPTATPLAGRVVGLFFFQASTRTRLGFHAAAARLGATALALDTMRCERGMSRAESPLDAFRSVASYCDLIVLRHHDEHELRRMIAEAPVPVINAGSGIRHHPTQTLVDLFHVRSRLGRLDGLRWGIAGDLLHSRAARSLLDALAHFPPSELRLMSPEDRALPPGELRHLHRTPIRRVDALELSSLDVLYMAGYPEGVEPDRASPAERRRFRLTSESTRELPAAALILDPLPRIDEIDAAVDPLPQAEYFDQSRNGLFVRITVLEMAPSCWNGTRAATRAPARVDQGAL